MNLLFEDMFVPNRNKVTAIYLYDSGKYKVKVKIDAKISNCVHIKTIVRAMEQGNLKWNNIHEFYKIEPLQIGESIESLLHRLPWEKLIEETKKRAIMIIDGA